MLDPELIEQLAAHPEHNAQELNAALAEQGNVSVLLSLVHSAAAGAAALRIIAERARRQGPVLEAQARRERGLSDEQDAGVVAEIDRALLANPASPDDARDAVLLRHGDEPFFVLAAACHPRATMAAVERAAAWICRSPMLDRLWLALIPAGALPPLTAAEWAQDPDPSRREAAARLSQDGALLESLATDPARQVRRAVASNPAGPRSLLGNDPAIEVRARAQSAAFEARPADVAPSQRAPGPGAIVDSARFAAALRAMEHGGHLAADIAAALAGAGADLDEEGAMWAARLLPRERVVALIEQAGHTRGAAATGLALGLGLRDPGDDRLGGEDDFRELVAGAAKALSQAAAGDFGALTGKARLAAWIAAGVSRAAIDGAELVALLHSGPIAAEPMVLARAEAARQGLCASCCEAAATGAFAPAALIELGWRTAAVDDPLLIALARRMGRPRLRGHDLPDDEVDLDPSRRSLATLEQVVLSACRAATFSARTALAVVALDSRRVRYVLTPMPSWRGRLSGAMLGRVLRHHAGALAAGPAEARFRGEQMRGWTERKLSDIELAVAFAIGHITSDALIERLASGRHGLEDGVGLAAAAEARAAVAGAQAIRALIDWAARLRQRSGPALALWLLLEAHDRARPASMIASAVDSLAPSCATTSAVEALALLERRAPGRLETLYAQTSRGRGMLASGIARAYRAVGGLRDERGERI